MLIDASDWLNVTINTGSIVTAIAIAYWQHRHPERAAHRANLNDLRRLLAEGESICEHVCRFGPLAEQQLIRLGARDFAVRAAQSARRGPAHLRPALAGLASVADELARSAAFPSELRCAVVQDRTVRALAAAIDRTWIDLTTLRSR
jgi:hypothetical protein